MIGSHTGMKGYHYRQWESVKFWRRKASPLWRQSKIQMTNPSFRVSYDYSIIHIFRSLEMQPTVVSLSGMNTCSCATQGAVSISAFFSHTPFLSKTVLNLFQTSLLQARLLRKAAWMVCSRQVEFPPVCLFPLEWCFGWKYTCEGAAVQRQDVLKHYVFCPFQLATREKYKVLLKIYRCI